MSDVVIRVEGLSKRYEIGAKEAYGSLRDTLRHAAGAPARRLRKAFTRGGNAGSSANGGPPIIWALRDVSFEVKKGEVLGLIGRNGAGKSTLLKILSRITAPTEGRVGVNGQSAPSLKLERGFTPSSRGGRTFISTGRFWA